MKRFWSVIFLTLLLFSAAGCSMEQERAAPLPAFNGRYTDENSNELYLRQEGEQVFFTLYLYRTLGTDEIPGTFDGETITFDAKLDDGTYMKGFFRHGNAVGTVEFTVTETDNSNLQAGKTLTFNKQ